MAKITYTNKVKIKDIPVAEVNKFTADNANEIKTIVNELDDLKINFENFNTYALMIAFENTYVMTIAKVLNDENKGINNTIYYIYPDGTRIWIAATDDN